MRYYLVDYVREKGNGFSPILPRGTGFLLLADPGFKCLNRKRWGLFRCWRDVKPRPGILVVSERLHTLLDSGERYPPAIARAYSWINRHCEGKKVSRTEFLSQYEDILYRSPRMQATDRYLLAEAARMEIGYLTPGEFCWVLKYYPESQTVSWVADDYSLYTNPVTDFSLDRKALRRLR